MRTPSQTPTRTEPWYAAVDLRADDSAPVVARAWVDACAASAGVAPAHRAEVRRMGTELAREAAMRAGQGGTIRLEVDVVGPVLRVSARGPATTQRLGSRAVEALRSAFEWGVERVRGDSRLVWCHLQVA